MLFSVLRNIVSRKGFMVIVACLSIIGYGYFVFAAAPSGGYNPGQTLNPDCAPTDTDCLIKPSLTTADNGLTATGTNVQLGGTLTKNTQIDQNGFDYLLATTVPTGLGGTLITKQSLNAVGSFPGTFSGYVTPGNDAARGVYYTSGNSISAFFGAGGLIILTVLQKLLQPMIRLIQPAHS